MPYFFLAAAVVFCLSFLLGSIPFGVVISKAFYHTDIRDHGSGNIGTTNAIRAMGKRGGYSVFLLDFGKGLLSGLLAVAASVVLVNVNGLEHHMSDVLSVFNPLRTHAVATSGLIFFVPQRLASTALLGCTLGHVFSPWLGFKGGKGIAVAVGCLFVTFGAPAALLEIALFAALTICTRYVSVGSIAAAAACPFFALYMFWGDWPSVVICALLGSLVVWAHRGNIARLRAGTENRVGAKKKQQAA